MLRFNRIVRMAVLCSLTMSSSMHASPSELCHQAAQAAALETDVPLPILTAILLAESGRPGPQGRQPWPWTLHAEGVGQWLGTRKEATDRLRNLVASGHTNVDIGCFQVNLRWHGARYDTPETLLDPIINARHASAFLADLHATSQDWRVAAGQYHSRDPQRAERYARRLEAMHAAVISGSPPTTPLPASRHLPQTGPLVDLSQRVAPLIGSTP